MRIHSSSLGLDDLKRYGESGESNRGEGALIEKAECQARPDAEGRQSHAVVSFADEVVSGILTGTNVVAVRAASSTFHTCNAVVNAVAARDLRNARTKSLRFQL